MAGVGYDDTPKQPWSKWKVHDSKRPQARVVTPGATDSEPPSDAVVLFDGKDASGWVGRDGGAIEWTVGDGMMEVKPRTGDIQTKEQFGDCQLHIEWAAPAEVKGDSQGRGNSGVFLMGLYEIQVLDGYNNPTYADGITAAIYGQYPPLVNACRKPGEWQTYDIFFVAPRFDEDKAAAATKLVRPARVTVVHNGVLVHHHREAMGPTGHKKVASYDTPHPSTGPLRLQDHSNPVRYRNIWIREIGDYDEG